LYPEARHQPLLSEDEGVDIVLQRAGRGGLCQTLVHQDDARADADLETVLVVQLLELPQR
jgi:hypothetical protein